MSTQTKVRLFVALVCAAGLACLAWGFWQWTMPEPLLFAAYLCLVAIASGLKVVLPGFEATASVSFVFFLLSICSLSLTETLLLGITAAIVQCYWKASKHLRFIHFAFNLSQVSIALVATYETYSHVMRGMPQGRMPLAMLAACVVYFIFNSVPVAGVVSLTEQKSFFKKWQESYAWAFPSYLIGAAIAGIILIVDRHLGWELSVLVMPAVYALYRTYAVHLEKLESHSRHLQEIADLHLRTVETLALAIEAKDHTTGDHIQRVQIYSLEIGKDLGLKPIELDALRAASVLHDIGKIAVPEHIIGKPGKLTPEEFERMKIHPVVGAEILEQIRFPYSVVPIVRSHHEKWDGSGYPDGLVGEQIPIGARILAAVDCLDALATDRQYRRALPLDEAMQCVEREAGKSFDPKVVAALKARYIELERFVKQQAPQARPKLSIDVKIQRGGAPAAGYAVEAKTQNEAQRVLAPTVWSGDNNENLSINAIRLCDSIRYDSIAVFMRQGEVLKADFALGVQMSDLKQLTVSVGEGLVGWVAGTGETIINGNPRVEANFAHRDNGLCCALAVPIKQELQTIGVLAVYCTLPDAFTTSDLQKLKNSAAQIAALLHSSSDPGPAGALRTTQLFRAKERMLVQ
jgi:putative nucleotidyltransferase with HDIG domain